MSLMTTILELLDRKLEQISNLSEDERRYLKSCVIADMKKESRKDATSIRKTLIERSNGRCEICSYGITVLLNAHHIFSVDEGGPGVPQNLIMLCPNCHDMVHKIISIKADRIKRDQMYQYIPYPIILRLMDVAHKTLLINEDGTRIEFASEIISSDQNIKYIFD